MKNIYINFIIITFFINILKIYRFFILNNKYKKKNNKLIYYVK